MKSFFREDVSVQYEGRTLTFTLAEQQALVSRGNYWHGAGDPSSWLSVATFFAVRRKHPTIGESEALDLASAALGVSRDKLIATIRWHEQYMRWHDGDHSYTVLDPSF